MSFYPCLHWFHQMVLFMQYMHQPDGYHPPWAKSHPIAMCLHETVHGLLNAHSFQHAVDNRDVIHLFHYDWSTRFSCHT